MYKQSIEQAPQRRRGGLISHILLQKDDVQGDHLAITWVEVEPGGQQTPHQHDSEQAYIIIQGEGWMRVGDEEENVHRGDMVYIPTGVLHGIKNVSQDKLIYISSSTPAFDLKALYDNR